ncbi:MAG: hypothetical protein F6K03_00950 [Kamptonema sp. SIO4C4]|nr:hypothetical protein [Kamptonema sp. SIO4C4]
MYPGGHARNTTADLKDILAHKFRLLGSLAFENPEPIIERYNNISNLNAEELRSINDYEIIVRGSFK